MITQDHLWAEMVTAAGMRAVETAAIDAGVTTGWAMMQQAGEATCSAALEEWPDLAGGSHLAVVLCGPGNNGGDGFVLAAALLRRGWDVEVFLYGDESALKGDAATACETFRKAGGAPRGWSAEAIAKRLSGATGPVLVVEALFGTGLRRDCDEVLRTWAEAWDSVADNGGDVRLLTLDVPAGISTDTGRRLGELVFEADLCVTFHLPKVGHFLGDAPDCIDALRVVPIGLPPETHFGAGTPLMCPPRIGGLGKRGGHKYHEGHVLVLAGPAFAGGAARLAARGALRIGAGLVTVGAEREALPEHAAQLTAIMLREVADGGALTRRLRDDERLNALCLGPGLGTDARAAEIVQAAISSGRRAVLDADALTILSQRRPLFQQLHGGCVLTPHAGEFKRLFPQIAGRIGEAEGYTKLQAARDAARDAGCVVLLKGPATIVADPEGQTVANMGLYHRASGWLATAGTGDVLAGMVAGLMARGLPPVQAAGTAAWLHVEAALVHGPGLIAEDLPEALPAVFRDLDL